MSRDNEAACRKMKAARTNYALACVCAAIGGGFICVTIRDGITGEEFRPGPLVAGALVTGSGILLLSRYNKRSKRAVDLYNEHVYNTHRPGAISLSLASTRDGYGLVLTF